jgi:predicted alpha/beta superfamily hydrolase
MLILLPYRIKGILPLMPRYSTLTIITTNFMRATFVWIFFMLISSISCFCQEVIHKTFHSQALKDSIKYNVWLPRNWDANEHYPSVYMNSYGALGNNGMLVAAQLNNFINSFPPTIVIDILSGQIDKMDYSYITGEVGETGLKFIECLKNELIPQVEATYRTTHFRAFIGQSYSSSYANYLFLRKPGVFNAYILFTPEKIEKDEPPFSIDEKLLAYYKTHPTFYYIAPAGQDIERRKDYAAEIQSKVKVLDSSVFYFKYELFPDANHNTIVSAALLPGLKFIFGPTLFQVPHEEKSIAHWFDSTTNRVKDIYGIEMLKKNSNFQMSLLNIVAAKKDEKGLDYFASYFNDTSSRENSLMLFNTGYTYLELGNSASAEEYYKKSINEAKRRNELIDMCRGYVHLAIGIYWTHDKNKEAAWNTLVQGFDDTKLYALKYLSGQLASEGVFNLDQAITNLYEFIRFRNPILGSPDSFYSLSDTYLLLAKCYYYKTDKTNALSCLNKCLKENPNNGAALKWKSEAKL